MTFLRTVATVLVAPLMWILFLGIFETQKLDILWDSKNLGAFFLSAVSIGTMAALWSIAPMYNWASGKKPIIGFPTTATRIGIAVIATIIFTTLVQSLMYRAGIDTTFWRLVTLHGMEVFMAVAFTTLIVDLIIHE